MNPRLSLHHVAFLVRNVAEAASFYTQRFGYSPATEIVHDPKQTAHVQFFKLPGDRVYLELIAPDRADSKLTNALEKGGGLNHVCYATDDIEMTCEQLRAQGLFLIQAPTSAVAFAGRRIAWMMGRDRMLVELVERGGENQL
jgi:methylmalonyl-CoA/ethylmalonyl-CoA epimerase